MRLALRLRRATAWKLASATPTVTAVRPPWLNHTNVIQRRAVLPNNCSQWIPIRVQLLTRRVDPN